MLVLASEASLSLLVEVDVEVDGEVWSGGGQEGPQIHKGCCGAGGGAGSRAGFRALRFSPG